MTDVPFTKKLRIDFAFLDSAGNPAKVDVSKGLPVVATTFGSVVETLEKGDGYTTLIDPAGVGSGSVSVTADVDLGDGEKAVGFALDDFNALASPEASAVKASSSVE